MHRTELCFRGLHERILRLEERPSVLEPTDEQVERVLRKILAERFADPATCHHAAKQETLKNVDYFVKDPNDSPYPKPVIMDVNSILVSPDSVPSKAYTETFQMLEDRLREFPGTALNIPEYNDENFQIKTRSPESD
jgi:hypothetical protein